MSERLSTRCPQCQSVLSYTPEELRSPVRCGGCGRTFQVRTPASTTPVPAMPTATAAALHDGPPSLLDGLASHPAAAWTSAAHARPPAPTPAEEAAPGGGTGRIIAGLAGTLALSIAVNSALAFIYVSRGRGPQEVAVAAAASVPAASQGASATSVPTPGPASTQTEAVAPPPTPAPPPAAPPAPPVQPPEPPDPTAPKVVKLPAEAEGACVGGGGRYYILHLAKLKQLAVFDLSTGRVEKFLPLASEKVRIAAGSDKLWVFYVDYNTAARYDLKSLEREATLKLPFEGTLRSVAMGSASTGPILVTLADGLGPHSRVNLQFLDGESLKRTTLRHPHIEERGRETVDYRAGPDGRCFSRSTGHEKIELFVVEEDEIVVRARPQNTRFVLPTGDGYVVSMGGVFTEELNPVDQGKSKGRQQPRLHAPAHGGPFFLRSLPNDHPAAKAGARTGVHLTADGREVAVLKHVEMPPEEYHWSFRRVSADERVVFHPPSKSIVVLPSGGEPRLLVHPFDLDAALEQCSVDYLFAASKPPPAKRGAPYSYRIAVKSKKGGVKFTLDAGPEGMKTSPTGEVVWTPPSDFAAPVPVVVRIGDASGAEIFHAFRIVPAAAGVSRTVELTSAEGGVAEGALAESEAGASSDPKAPDEADGVESAPYRVEDGAVVKLPGAADDVCYAGGGRFLLLRMPAVRQIACVDLLQGKIVKYVPMTEPGMLVAGGLRKFYLASPSVNVLQRWDLKRMEKETTVQSPHPMHMKTLRTGHATDGPLLVVGSPSADAHRGAWGLVDPRSMKALPVEEHKQSANRLDDLGSRGKDGPLIRGSADGRVYAFWRSTSSPQGVNTMAFDKGFVKSWNLHESRGALLLGPTGTVFTSKGSLTTELEPLGGEKLIYSEQPPIPAVEGPWYVALRGLYAKDESLHEATVGLPSVPRFKVSLPNVPGLVSLGRDGGRPDEAFSGLPLYDRVHLLPSAGVAAEMPATCDQIRFHRVDLRGGLDATGEDYLMVVGAPPSSAARPGPFRYVPEVWSNKEGVKVELKRGPPGMRVVGGAVEWDVPAAFSTKEVEVRLQVSDGGGRETSHSFSLTIVDAASAVKK